MDARPQRPVRAFHIQVDENVAPSSKTQLHQRHKSTGTLSTMLGAGGLKGAGKRTAFGDVSNTAKNFNHIVQDDSVTVGKNTPYEGPQKPVQTLEKPAAFLRPAQRPLTVSGLKSLLGSNATTSASSIIQPSVAELQQPSQAAKPRTLSKRATTIYKDATVASSDPASSSSAQATSQNAIPIPPVHQTLGPRQHKSQPQLKTDQPVLRRTQSRFIGQFIEELPQIHLPVESKEEQIKENQAIGTIEELRELKTTSTKASEGHHEAVAAHIGEEQERIDGELPALPLVSEPEEYSDEEEEEEVYDDQGYTTAHSYRSKGDNTTGGATTVLFPKVTSKVKRELAKAKDLVEAARTQEEIEDEAWDTSMVAEYGDEIFEYMRDLEIKMLPNAHYMDNQTEIQWSMRSVLMDWLIQVHHRFSLLPETLFLCVNYIDRFLSCKIVSLGKLQLVGATAIFVAAKYEEINCPSVSEIVYMVDGGYTIDEILKAERFMLSMLQFELGWPGPMSFLRRISKADDYDLETRTLAKYFLEVTIMDERFVGSPPSFVAAGTHCLARVMLKKGDWSPAHVYYSGYTWPQLRPLVTMIMECCENPTKHHSAVYEKYSDRRYKRASIFVKGEMEKGFVLPISQLSASQHFLPPMDEVATRMPYETIEAAKRMVQIRG